MEKVLKTTKTFLMIQILLLLISMIISLFNFSLKIFIAQIVLITLTYFSVRKIDDEDSTAIAITALTGIIGIIIGFILTDILVTVIYGAILIQILKFIIYPMGIEDSSILKILYNMLGIICIIAICYFSINNKVGLSGNIDDTIKIYNKIQLETSMKEVEKSVGKSGDKEAGQLITSVDFYSNRDKGYRVTAYFEDDICTEKILSYNELTLNEDLGKETIDFSEFDQIKEQKEKLSLNYYLEHSKEFDKEYKTLEEYKNDNMIYLSDIIENLGDEGIEIEKEIYLGEMREKYLFADKNKNYIIIYVQGNIIFSIEGKVNGEEIDWKIY